MTSSTIMLFNCLLLISFVFSSIAANIPDSEWPFEFNNDKGSKITEDNILTQLVSSDGKTVISTNDAQPIKKYKSNNNENTEKQSTDPIVEETHVYKQNPHKIKQEYNNYIPINRFGSPYGHTSYMSPTVNNQWNMLDNFSKLFPGMSNLRVVYI